MTILVVSRTHISWNLPPVTHPTLQHKHMSPTHKYCSACKESHPISDFNKLSHTYDGLQRVCKKALRAYRQLKLAKFKGRMRTNMENRLGARPSMYYVECLLGVKWEDAMARLDGWDKSGNEIDHIIPVSLYNLSSEIDLLKCWNISNLQVLTRDENSAKRARWTDKADGLRHLWPTSMCGMPLVCVDQSVRMPINYPLGETCGPCGMPVVMATSIN